MKPKNNRPNILLITCDQLRSDFVGAYGSEFMHTPNIDRLAQEGCLYENAYSPNPVCIPARHNMLTGLTAKHHGYDDNYFGKEAKPCPWNLPTFPQILSDGGYETIAIGKIHFQPERRHTGFDFFYNMDELPATREEDDYALFLKENGHGSVTGVHGVRHVLYMQPQRSLVPEELHGSRWVADRAVDYFNQSQGRRPFLMWAGFIHPHPPLDIPERLCDRYKGKIPAPAVGETPLSALAEENKTLACLHTPEAVNRVRELYAAAVTFVDEQIGRMVESLRELGLLDKTMIVFTSDHGEMLGDLGTYQKFLPYDASCKIPLVVRYPNKVAPGTRERAFVDLNDLLPTFTAEAGLRYPADYDLPGETIFPITGVKNRHYQYVEHQRDSKRWCMLRDARYKYIHHYGDGDQLFDMAADPHETHNLLHGHTTPEILEIRDRLKARLIQYERRYGLPDGIVGGQFEKREPYLPTRYFEMGFPAFPRNAVDAKEIAAFEKTDDAILRAIEKEPTVKLSENNAEEILRTHGGYDDGMVQALFARAKQQGNY